VAKEGAACCKNCKQVLGELYNPPLDPDYLRILQQTSFSHDSRLLNAALAMGSQCTSPSRAQGGLGFHEKHYAHLSLLGTTYLVLRNPHSGNNPFDNYMLPKDLLLETAAQDLGADYAVRLLSAREYLQARHPLASRLRPVAEVPAQRLDFSKVIRLEANSSHSGAMELAHVSSGVVGRGAMLSTVSSTLTSPSMSAAWPPPQCPPSMPCLRCCISRCCLRLAAGATTMARARMQWRAPLARASR
jgi:hypothetical protein